MASRLIQVSGNQTNWNQIIGTPTTLAGYGITDAANSSHSHAFSSLSGVALTSPANGQLLQFNGTNWVNFTPAYLTSNQTITLSGDITGTGTSSITTTLANSGVTANTYRSVTVDSKGRVTAGTNPTTLLGYGITDSVDLSSTQTVGGAKTFSGLTIFQSGIRLSATSTRTVSTTGAIAGEWREAIPAGLFTEGIYIMRFYWESVGNIPYILSGAFFWTPIKTNDGTGKSKSFAPPMSSHIGGDYEILMRSKCSTSQVTSGLEYSLNFTSPSANLTFSLFALF